MISVVVPRKSQQTSALEKQTLLAPQETCQINAAGGGVVEACGGDAPKSAVNLVTAAERGGS